MKKIFLFITVVLTAVVLYADEQADIFNRTTKYLDKGGILFQFHNTQNLSKQLESLIQLGTENSQTANLQLGMEFFQLLSTVADLKSLQGVGLSVKDLNSTKFPAFALYQNKSFVAIDPKSSGSVFAVVKNANGRFPSAANLPLNTIFATAVKLNWSNAYKNIEPSVHKDDSIKNIIAMIEQNLGMKIPTLMQSISGDFFLGIYKGETPDSFHFLVNFPDSGSVLKKMAQRQMAPLMKVYKDKSASFELPLPQGKFGAAYTVLFAQNKVFIYNSNAQLNKLLNTRKQEKLLSSLAPQIFGFLNKCEGNSYTVINLNTSDILPGTPNNQYLAGSIGVMTPDGYLQSGKSNFMFFNFIEYAPLLDLINKIKTNSTQSHPASPLQ